jgi:hypothetical protein
MKLRMLVLVLAVAVSLPAPATTTVTDYEYWSYHCDLNGVSNAVTGSFTVDEIRATRNGWIGRITVVSPQCNYAGYIGGVKDSF